jgi:hypothetical protein
MYGASGCCLLTRREEDEEEEEGPPAKTTRGTKVVRGAVEAQITVLRPIASPAASAAVAVSWAAMVLSAAALLVSDCSSSVI